MVRTMKMPNRLKSFLRRDSGAITKDWIVIGVSLAGLIASSAMSIYATHGAAQQAGRGLVTSSVGNIGCSLSSLIGNPCLPRALAVLNEERWDNWCSRPNGLMCQFRLQRISMSDGTVWTAIEVISTAGTRQVVWRNSVGQTVEAPILS